MLNGALARRYAQALFEIVESASLDTTETELRAAVQLIQENEGITKVLNHPHVSIMEKKELINKVLGGHISSMVLNFLYLIVDRRRQNLLPIILSDFSKMADEARQTVEAKVSSVKKLSAEQEKSLQEALAKTTGKNIRLVCESHPELIGGIKVQVGDRVWDGTIIHALDRMREELRKSARV